jgi:hypothetical protein
MVIVKDVDDEKNIIGCLNHDGGDDQYDDDDGTGINCGGSVTH